MQTLQRQIRQARMVTITEVGKVEKALENYNAENLDSDTPGVEEIPARVETNMEGAHGLVDQEHKGLVIVHIPLVVDHLKEKYGDKQALIDELLGKLHSARARSSRLEEKQLPVKFTVEVQKHVQRQNPRYEQGNAWDTSNLPAAAKVYIKSELKKMADEPNADVNDQPDEVTMKPENDDHNEQPRQQALQPQQRQQD
ncbi:hypothetical protein GCK32_000093 [Trichostrongylus colubriformis]|uniref:Uncharacterized protein n=1 Tax=Trichostrongylus colubriformis TaxID=6319 RepID=A0AAN8FSK0_TRICO